MVRRNIREGNELDGERSEGVPKYGRCQVQNEELVLDVDFCCSAKNEFGRGPESHSDADIQISLH